MYRLEARRPDAQPCFPRTRGDVPFYRHSDGYPEGVKDSLDKFCGWVNSGMIRRVAMQAAGWLIAIGIKEYQKYTDVDIQDLTPTDWKIGAYEPCSDIYQWAEYVHVVHVGVGEHFSFPQLQPERSVDS